MSRHCFGWNGDLRCPVVQPMFAPANLDVQVHVGCMCSWEGLLARMADAHQVQAIGASWRCKLG